MYKMSYSAMFKTVVPVILKKCQRFRPNIGFEDRMRIILMKVPMEGNLEADMGDSLSQNGTKIQKILWKMTLTNIIHIFHRYLLDNLSEDDADAAEEIKKIMDELSELVLEVTYPDERTREEKKRFMRRSKSHSDLKEVECELIR